MPARTNRRSSAPWNRSSRRGGRSREYKDFVRDHYDGPAGAFTAVTGVLTGHDAAGRPADPARRIRRPRLQDTSSTPAAATAGIPVYLLKTADADAMLTAFDLSQGMLARARNGCTATA